MDEQNRNIKYISLILGAICIVVFIIQILISGFTEIFYLTNDALLKPWQFLTAVFLHGSPIHLIYNLFALVFFGFILEKLIGSRKFLILFLVSGIAANIVSFSFYPNSLGASGAIMALIGCVAVLRPMMVVWAFGIILPMFLLAIIWAAGSILGIFGFGDQSVGYLAHLTGIFIGVLYGFYLRLVRKTIKDNGVTYKTKIILPEEHMRLWEDYNLKR